MQHKYSEPFQYPKCPHCGGEHWGQRFDDCTYVNILADPNSSDEQRLNATEHLRLHRGDHPEPFLPDALIQPIADQLMDTLPKKPLG